MDNPSYLDIKPMIIKDNHYNRGYFTAIDLGCIVFPVIIGGICAAVLNHYMGRMGIWLGFILGFFIIHVWYWIKGYTLGPYRFQYQRPYCTCSKFRGYEDIENRNGAYVYKCSNCGHVFINDNRSCDILLPDGSRKPYMKRVRFLPWRYVKEDKSR